MLPDSTLLAPAKRTCWTFFSGGGGSPIGVANPSQKGCLTSLAEGAAQHSPRYSKGRLAEWLYSGH